MDIATPAATPVMQYELAFPSRYPSDSPSPLTMPSDRSFLNEHATLHLANCFAWLEACAPRSIQAVVTDPPYGVHEFQPAQIQKLRHGGGGVWRSPTHLNGHQRAAVPRFTVLTAADRQGLWLFYTRFARLIARVVVPGANIIVAAHPLLCHTVATAMATSGLESRGSIMRQITTLRGGDRPKGAEKEFRDVSVMPRANWEPWLLFRAPLDGRVQDNLRRWGTGGFRRNSVDRPFGDLIVSHPAGRAERALAPHPCLKPQAFLQAVVRAALPLGRGLILDPFAGSGSTLAAANAIGYRSVGIEHDPVYFAMAEGAIPRLQKLTACAIQPSKRDRLSPGSGLINSKYDGGSGSDSGHEGECTSVVAGVDAAPVFEVSEHVLDPMATTIEGCVVRDRHLAVLA